MGWARLTEIERMCAQLSVEEKAVVLACAISIDFDYFSRHSGGGIPLPFFIPMPGMGEVCERYT